MPQKPLTYADAGVSIDAGNALVKAIGPLARSTARPGADAELGGFGGLFDLKAAGFTDPLLVAANDGVGTKLKLAIDLNRHQGVGIDLVAHGTTSDADTIRDTAIAQPLIVAAGLLTLKALFADGRRERVAGIAGPPILVVSPGGRTVLRYWCGGRGLPPVALGPATNARVPGAGRPNIRRRTASSTGTGNRPSAASRRASFPIR